MSQVAHLPRVLLLTLVFSPDGVSTATIMTQLAAQLHGLGHDLAVCTTTPHYNREAEALAAQPLQPKWGRLLFQSDFQGIPVYHARVHPKGSRVLARLLDYLTFHAVSTLAGIRLGGLYDVVIAPSPPLTIGLNAMALAFWRRVPFVYNVQEIYPDIAVSLGILRHRPLIRALESVERFIYRRARAVVVISEDFRRRLLEKGVPDHKLHLIPNFVDTGFIRPGSRNNPFSSEHQLDGRFVVLYAGNIGLTQDFETVIAAAELLRDLPHLCFLVVGDGARRSWLERQIDTRHIENIRLLPYQAQSTVPLIYASSDVCLVPLRQGTAGGTFPSKIYTILAAGRPAIVSADPDSELARIVQEARCGLVVPPGDPGSLAAAIRKSYLHRDSLRSWGEAGRAFVVQQHSPEAVARRYHELLVAMAEGRSV